MKFKLFFILILFLSLQACKRDKLVLTKIEGKQIPISDNITENQDIEDFVKPYRERVNNDLDSVISYAPETYSKKDGEFNTAIGNLLADLVFEQANPVFKKRTNNTIDAVLLNHGGIRSIISKGNITTRTAYQVMPFENSLIVVGLKGKQLDSMMLYLSKAKRAHPIHGMKITLDKNYKVTEALIQGKPINANKTYYIATNDYLYNGGDGMRFFQPNEGATVLDYKIRNATIDYLKKIDTIKPVIDNRFTRTK
jgi:5'-nucleotidase